MLEVRLFGKFDIKCDGDPVIIPSRAAQSLFAYLILTAGTLHRREKLAGMFWLDVPEEKARAYLRHELWRIRKAIPSPSDRDCLLADDINISFNSTHEYWLDVTAFTKGNERASVDELKNALSVFQGEFLPGFYEEWITQERERLQVLYEQKMVRLLALLESEERWQEILEGAEHWISLGQGPEAAYRYLMIAYDAMGDRAKVTATYERCVQALHELNLDTSEQTRALAFKRTTRLNIPILLTSFIGRERELNEVAELVSKSRLVTLTGSGGVGKTRLAIQVVAEVLEVFPDGVWFLDLAPVTDPVLVPNTLAEVLDLHLIGGSNLSITDLIVSYLRSRRVMIIFDNCEHLIDACARLVDSLLSSCEGLQIIATSREVLRVPGEAPYRVPSLQIPALDIESALDVLAKTESVQLFLERAAATIPRFTMSLQNALVIAQICKRLDGIPLAIELAAARVKVLTVGQILERLDDRFKLLTGGSRTALPRHQTLRATIEWSYDLLSEKERLLFQRLAVFVGGWTLEAAEAVCSGSGIEPHEVLDLLSQLVDKSILLAEAGNSGEIRYHRLETIRQFALEKLSESGEAQPFNDRHLEYFLKLAETAEPHLRRTEQIEWFKRLEAEHDNLRIALAWAMRKPSAEPLLRLAGSLGVFWYMRAHWVEGERWLDQVLGKTWNRKSNMEAVARAKVLYHRADIADVRDEHDMLKTTAASALALCEQVGDLWGVAFSRNLVAVHQAVSGLPRAMTQPSFEKSLIEFQRLGDAWGESLVLSSLAWITREAGARAECLEYIKRGIERARASGDRWQVAFSLLALSLDSLNYREWDEALTILQEVEQLYTEIDSSDGIAYVHHVRSDIYFASGDLKKAKAEAKLAAEGWQRVGERNFQSHMLFMLALIAEAESDFSTALNYAQKALVLRRDIGTAEIIAFALVLVGRFEYKQGKAELATQDIHNGLEFVTRGEVGNRELSNILVYLSEFFLEKKTKLAVQILALAESLAQFLIRSVRDQLYFDRYLSEARARLSEDEFASAWEAGSQMNADEAVACVLRELQ